MILKKGCQRKEQGRTSQTTNKTNQDHPFPTTVCFWPPESFCRVKMKEEKAFHMLSELHSQPNDTCHAQVRPTTRITYELRRNVQ